MNNQPRIVEASPDARLVTIEWTNRNGERLRAVFAFQGWIAPSPKR
jgi:hypothetical protein